MTDSTKTPSKRVKGADQIRTGVSDVTPDIGGFCLRWFVAGVENSPCDRFGHVWLIAGTVTYCVNCRARWVRFA